MAIDPVEPIVLFAGFSGLSAYFYFLESSATR